MKITLSKQIWLGFGAVLLLTATIGGVGYFGVSKEVNTMSDIILKDILYVEIADKIKIEMLRHRHDEKDFFLNIGNPEEQEKYLKKFAKESESIETHIKRLSELIQRDRHLSEGVKQKVANIPINYEKYYQGFHLVVKQVKSDSDISAVKANKLMNPYKAFIHDLESDTNIVVDAVLNMVRSKTTEASTDGNRTMDFLMILIMAGLLLTAAIGILIPRSITRLITRSVQSLSGNAVQVASASGQVSSASQSLAEGSSEQAASIEETSSSLEELSSMTKQNSDNANQARILANETKTTTELCSNTMQEMAAAIGQVDESSRETQKIIKTIDEIAFQTNLLALNAAVEAARAGEAGAGFAVVADEVRTLALRAAEAAKTTSSQIEDISNKINKAMELVLKSIDEFVKVDENTGKVDDLVSEIAVASNEQAQGIEQVNKAVAEMDKVVQQNAASAEESASASEELNAQAQEMTLLIGDLMALVNGNNGITNGSKTIMKWMSASEKVNSKGSSIKPLSATKSKDSEAKVINPKQFISLDDEAFKDF